MKPYKKVILTGALLTALTFTSGAQSALAQEAGVSASSTTPNNDARLEAKAKAEALRAENKAKMEAARLEAKAKKDELRKEREAFVLKQAQDRFVKAITEAEAGLLAAQAKLTEAKAAALAATDKTGFEGARKLFMEARKVVEKAMRPLLSAPKIGIINNKTPTLKTTAKVETTTTADPTAAQ